MTCSFFGHRFVSKDIEPVLRSTLIDLIKNYNVNIFYVGNNGEFDIMVKKVLKEFSKEYKISYTIVFAYLPTKKETFIYDDYENSIYPDGIEAVPKRFAIEYRNKWMINHSDYVVTYVINDIGSGAAKFKKIAERQKKTVINLIEK